MYRGEYYFLQIDAHLSFVNRWEMSLIQELESTGNEMSVLSTYLSDFVDSIDENGEAVRVYRPIMCNAYWKEWNGMFHVHHSTQPECAPAVKGTPQLHPWWAAGFSIS
jgi:[Skp1-protein]-hydroxyproline N-acetylglucosaminyltransferase